MLKCKGPNLEHAERCKARAEAYELLAIYYTLEARDQRIFVAMFNAMTEGEPERAMTESAQ